jgi:hypothetical protein
MKEPNIIETNGKNPLKFLSLGGRKVFVLYENSVENQIMIIRRNQEVIFEPEIIESRMENIHLDAAVHNDINTNKNGPLIGILYDKKKIDIFVQGNQNYNRKEVIEITE